MVALFKWIYLLIISVILGLLSLIPNTAAYFAIQYFGIEGYLSFLIHFVASMTVICTFAANAADEE